MERDFPNLIWDREGQIGILRLNSPDTLNALSMEIQQDLLDFLPTLNLMDDLRVVILTGEGKAFCAGGNMHRFVANYGKFKEDGGVHQMYSNRVAKALLEVEAPLISAINGPAIGGGLTLSLISDLRIASEKARFGAVFARVGVTPEYGSSFLLTRVVGLTKAMEMVLTAKIIDAPQALAIGLVNEVVLAEQLLDVAREFAREIASLPPFAVRMAKRVLRHGLESTLSQALDYEESIETLCFSSLDHKEAVTAFLEKRTPLFIGR